MLPPRWHPTPDSQGLGWLPAKTEAKGALEAQALPVQLTRLSLSVCHVPCAAPSSQHPHLDAVVTMALV